MTRDERVVVLVTTDELERLKEAAKEHGSPVSTLLRLAAMRNTDDFRNFSELPQEELNPWRNNGRNKQVSK